YCDHLDLHSFPTRRSSDLIDFQRPASRQLGNGGHGEVRKIQYSPVVDDNGKVCSGYMIGKKNCEAVQDGYHVIISGHSTTRQGRSEEHTSELQSRENLVCR